MKILESSERTNQVGDAPCRTLPQQRPLLIVFAIMEPNTASKILEELCRAGSYECHKIFHSCFSDQGLRAVQLLLC